MPRKKVTPAVVKHNPIAQEDPDMASNDAAELPQKIELTLQPKPPTINYKMLSLDIIDDPEKAMRTNITPQSVESLVISIRQVGLIEPLVVKPKNGRYEVIAGHRRKYACELANLVMVPCFISDASMEQTEMIKIHENLYREDVRPSDEALHFKYLIEHRKLSPVQIARLISKSENYVSERLAIFDYPQRLRDVLDSGQLSFSVCREFMRLNDEAKIIEYVHYAVRNGITQDAARKWVQDYKRSLEHKPIQQAVSYDPHTNQQTIESVAECFFCTTAVKLLEAVPVYVHPTCVGKRMQLLDEDKPAGDTPNV